MLEDYKSWFDRQRSLNIENFISFLTFPSVSTDPSYRDDVLKCKDWLVDYMKMANLDVSIWETPGYPVVFGEKASQNPSAPTVLFYGHYDVQPPSPLEEWITPPFSPDVRDNTVYARGAVDNKGQCFYTILAIQAFLECSKTSDINIKVLIEGEEEIGSPGLEAIALDKQQELQADYVFVVDVDMKGVRQPAVTLGMRGIININATISNMKCDVHSGVFGGIVLNPARALSQLLGNVWDNHGNVLIPHFYDDIKTLSPEELALFDWDQNIEKESKDAFGIRVFQGEGKFSLLESNWIRPSLEINGMYSGYTGEGFKTIIPSQASVKLSCRLVPGQDPSHVADCIVTFLNQQLSPGLKLDVDIGHGTSGFMTNPSSKAVDVVMQAYEDVYQTPCVRQLCGATIPIVSTLVKASQGEIVLMGVGVITDNMHAPNECFGLDRFEEGFLSVVRILELVSSKQGHS